MKGRKSGSGDRLRKLRNVNCRGESFEKFSADGSHFPGEAECKTRERHSRLVRKERFERDRMHLDM